MAQAHGWQVERKWYSGPGTRRRSPTSSTAARNELILHGLPYDNGVILADTRQPEQALCVSSFAYDLDRDTAGDWIGKLPDRVVIGSVLMSVLLVAWAAATVIVVDIAGARASHSLGAVTRLDTGPARLPSGRVARRRSPAGYRVGAGLRHVHRLPARARRTQHGETERQAAC